MSKSEKLWLSIDKKINNKPFLLGPYSSQAYLDDPKSLLFVLSRYKFCSKLLKGKQKVLEIGCGDAFGTALLTQEVDNIFCTDINKKLLSANKKRLKKIYPSINFEYHNFCENEYQEKQFDAVFAIDVLEHIYKFEEKKFFKNIFKSCLESSLFIFGTPNKTAEKYSSKYSKMGHVNSKNVNQLDQTMKKYFKNVQIFGMNDEVLHTGFDNMRHYLFAICSGIK